MREPPGGQYPPQTGMYPPPSPPGQDYPGYPGIGGYPGYPMNPNAPPMYPPPGVKVIKLFYLSLTRLFVLGVLLWIV